MTLQASEIPIVEFDSGWGIDPEVRAMLVEDNLNDTTGGRLKVYRLTQQGLSAGDDDTPVQEITALVLNTETGRMMYEKPYVPGQDTTPPDCSSTDGRIGIGKPGGECSVCPLNKFMEVPEKPGSVTKKCKEFKAITILQYGQIFPEVVRVPSASLKNFRNYMHNLTTRGIPVKTVMTKIRVHTNEIGKYQELKFEAHSRFANFIEVRKFAGIQLNAIEGAHRRVLAEPEERPSRNADVGGTSLIGEKTTPRPPGTPPPPSSNTVGHTTQDSENDTDPRTHTPNTSGGADPQHGVEI